MQDLLLKLLMAAIAAIIVSYIPMDAFIKRICYLVIGAFVLILLLSVLFGIQLLS